jgi:Cysteine-rich secretory protein family
MEGAAARPDCRHSLRHVYRLGLTSACRAATLRFLFSIVRLLAALMAILTVSPGVHPGAVIRLPAQHTVGAAAWQPSYLPPAGTDAFTWLHAHNNPAYFPPPPPPAPAPVAASDNGVPVAAAPAPLPPVVVGSTQQAYINGDRASAGLAPLTWNSCLAGIAYQSALRMANQGYISHAGGAGQDLGCGLGVQAGENVGYWTGGINDGQLNSMFMNSPDHRANIMGPYRYVATAWVVARNGYAYLAVEFS